MGIRSGGKNRTNSTLKTASPQAVWSLRITVMSGDRRPGLAVSVWTEFNPASFIFQYFYSALYFYSGAGIVHFVFHPGPDFLHSHRLNKPLYVFGIFKD